jgi:PAS domain S-box-containing protein
MEPSIKSDLEISILYVEGEAAAREMVSSMLAREIRSLRLFSAESGETGLAIFREHQPDIVVTDIHMAVMDGVRMADAIKSLNPETLIVAVTAFSDTQNLLNAIEIGVNHYVLKPIDYGKLFAAIRKCIEIVRLKRQVRKQNEHIRQLSRAIEDSPCSVFITDGKGTIKYVNPKFTKLTGYTAEEVIGQNPRILKSDAMPADTYEELWSVITSGREWRGEFLNRKKNGDLYWEAASISPIFSDQGDITHFVAVKEDITERKQAEERIEILNTNLAAYASELEMANQELEAFSYSVSHDLRSPLTAINGYCQIIQTLCGAKLDDECRGYLKEIHDGTLRMNQLIKTLLDFARINRYELRRQKINLSGLASEVAASLQRADPARRATIRISEGMTAYGDENLLRLVLENLLGNAWKYAGRREEAVIESGVTDTDGTPAYFIRDNGAGFDMADAGQLFIPFQRLHATDDFAGHGIGLATVQRIIQRHGGRVWAEGEPDNGATFYFTLPAGDTAPSPRTSSLFPETMSRRP